MVFLRGDESRWRSQRAAARSGLVVAAIWFTGASSQTGGTLHVQREQPYCQPATYCASEIKPKESFWQRTIEDPIAFYNLVLALFSGALVVVAIIQIRFLIRATVSSEAAADLSQKQILLAGRNADLAEKQQLLARLHYLGSHPPKVILREVYFDIPPDNKLITEDRQVSFLLVNTGATEARITESRVLLEW